MTSDDELSRLAWERRRARVHGGAEARVAWTDRLVDDLELLDNCGEGAQSLSSQPIHVVEPDSGRLGEDLYRASCARSS
jgi:hypothetical protein